MIDICKTCGEKLRNKIDKDIYYCLNDCEQTSNHIKLFVIPTQMGDKRVKESFKRGIIPDNGAGIGWDCRIRSPGGGIAIVLDKRDTRSSGYGQYITALKGAHIKGSSDLAVVGVSSGM